MPHPAFPVSNGMNQGYDIFEQKGKTIVRAWGKTENELFSHALLGLAALIRPDVAPNTKTVTVRAHIHGDSFSDTLSKFLSHVLFENEMHQAVFSAMDVIILAPLEIECELVGREVEHYEEDIEGVTLLGNGITRTANGLEVQFSPIQI
jgi:SHS2 domain-containing protein